MDSRMRDGARNLLRRHEGFGETVLALAPAVVALCMIAAEVSQRAIDGLQASEVASLVTHASFERPTWTRCNASPRAALPGEVVTTCRQDNLLVPLRWTQVVLAGTSPQRVKSERAEIDGTGVRFFPETLGPLECTLTEEGQVVSEGREMTFARLGDVVLVRCGCATGRPRSTAWVLGLRKRPSRWACWLARTGGLLAVLGAVLAWLRRDEAWRLPWRIAVLDEGGSHRFSCGTPVHHGVPGRPSEVLVIVDNDREGDYRKGAAVRASRVETARTLAVAATRTARRRQITAWGFGTLACAMAVLAHTLR